MLPDIDTVGRRIIGRNPNQSMVIADPFSRDTPVIFASPGFYDFTLYDPKDVIGRNCRFLQGKETDPVARMTLHASIVSQSLVEVTILNFKADGSRFWNRLVIEPIYDPSQRLAYFIGFQNPVDVPDSTRGAGFA